MKTSKGLKYAGFGVLGVAGVFVFTFVVMWLWNWLVPELFNGPVLTYWQTIGLLILSKIIFSGIGGSKSDRSKKHSRHHHCDPEDFPEKYRDKWKQKFEAKMGGKTDRDGDQGEVIIAE